MSEVVGPRRQFEALARGPALTSRCTDPRVLDERVEARAKAIEVMLDGLISQPDTLPARTRAGSG
ncbi:hypothetical protein ABGB07_13550 [Micromonosporaceae bacterium B7E4]